MSCNCVGRPSFGRRYGKRKPREDTVKTESAPAAELIVETMDFHYYDAATQRWEVKHLTLRDDRDNHPRSD